MNNKEVYIKIILSLCNQLYDGYDKTIAMILERSVPKGLLRTDIKIEQPELHAALMELLEYSCNAKQSKITDELIVECIKSCLNKHHLDESLGSSLVADNISRLIKADFGFYVEAIRVELLMHAHIPEFSEQQESKRRIFREYYNIAKTEVQHD